MGLSRGFSKSIWVGALALSVVACGGGNGGSGSDNKSSACGSTPSDPFCRPWYDVYGTACESGASMRPIPGCNFYADGNKIIDQEDPYYSAHVLSNSSWDYIDPYGYEQTHTGYGWLSPNGILYDEFGFALNEEVREEGRDLMAELADRQRAMTENAGLILAERHALSEVTGIRIAETLGDWATLAKKHGRTERDLADFSSRLFGVTASEFRPAMAEAARGDLSGVERLNGDVASHWDTDPETSKEILMGWYRREIQAFRAAQSAQR